MKTRKRILSVKIKRMIDTDPDTSHLGEYSNHATSEFSIDRMHSEDCLSLEANHRETVDKLERIKKHINDLYNANLGTFNGALGDSPAHREAEFLDEAERIILELQEDAAQCDCGGHNCSSRELRYFNPSFNYITKQDKPADGLTPDEVRKYVRQDYERMERLNAGDWCYTGIRAEAEIQTGPFLGTIDTIQTITSGGLWGIESDSDRSYLESVQQEELANLKSELLALGFSRRAISQAFKSVEEVQG